MLLAWCPQRRSGRFKVRRIILIATLAALVLGIPISCFTWLAYPHVKLTIYNETPVAMCDVRISFLFGQRTAAEIRPGGSAVTEIQSGGSAKVSLSYRNPGGAQKKEEVLYYSGEHGAEDRGYLEVHVTGEGTKLVNRIYTAIDIPYLTWRVWPKGRMTVK